MSTVAADLALDLHAVQKVYGSGRKKVHALRGVSLQVRGGEIFGLLGPNGAGKSTLVKILMTVVRPDQAGGTVLGKHVGHKATLARIGYLPEHHRFPRYLTGRQLLQFFAALSGVPRALRKSRSGELLELVGMAPWADRRIDTYSKGMLQRVGVAQALVNDPALVVLDEPTDGVDPIGRQEIRSVLLRLREQGRTIFINSHLLSELEMICNRVAIMVRGQVVRQGTIEELSRHQQWYELELPPENLQAARTLLNFDGPGPVFKGELQPGLWMELHALPHATVVRLGTGDPLQVQATLDRLRASGCIIRRLGVVRPNLEELFMEAVQDDQTGESKGVGTGKGVGEAQSGQVSS